MPDTEPAYERRLGTIYAGIDSTDEIEKRRRSSLYRNLSLIFYVPVLDVQS